MKTARSGGLERLRLAAAALRREAVVLYLAMGHRAAPWSARVLAAVVLLYALSPLDLIPDAVPVLGLLDDLVIVPLGLLAVRALMPSAVLAECRAAAGGVQVSRRWRRMGAACVVLLWLLGLALTLWIILWR